MATLRFPRDTPHGGWRYWQKESKLLIQGDNLRDLANNIIRHRQYAHLEPLDIETVELEIQRQICHRMGEDGCVREGPDDSWVPAKPVRMGVSEVLAFSRAALAWAETGGELVSMDENERRHKICVDCPMNVSMSGCACTPLYKAIALAIPVERRFDDLNICQACGCTLKAKCAAPASVIQASDLGRDIQYPGWCWVNSLAKP